MKVVVWDENLHENNEEIKKVYPEGISRRIVEGVRSENSEALDWEFVCVHSDMPDFGLSDTLLEETDVLVFWAHKTHEIFPEYLVEKLYQKVMSGMGLIVLHSAHLSKIFRRLMGTTCTLRYCYGDVARVWKTNPQHPIAEGVSEYFDIEEETYGEFFDIPKPDDVVFMSWFSGGNLFRGACTWQRSYGKIFYFHPGHETNASYYHPEVLKIIGNGIKWANSKKKREKIVCEYWDKKFTQNN